LVAEPPGGIVWVEAPISQVGVSGTAAVGTHSVGQTPAIGPGDGLGLGQTPSIGDDGSGFGQTPSIG
jgi:hypothetical protein